MFSACDKVIVNFIWRHIRSLTLDLNLSLGSDCISAPQGFPGLIHSTETLSLDTQLCFMSVFFNLGEKKSQTLWGFRESSCWEEFSHMKEQLDEMNIPSRPGCCFRYSYRHTAGRRLNKHYSIVKNMTLRSSSSAAVTPPNHSAVRFCLHVCFNSKTFSFGLSPSLQMVFFCLRMYIYTLSRLI